MVAFAHCWGSLVSRGLGPLGECVVEKHIQSNTNSHTNTKFVQFV